MTSETIANDPNSGNGALNYSLDAVGNRLTRTSTLAAISSTTSTYNANDRLNSDSYDANGNTTSADGTTYAYNFENRLALSTQNSVLSTFVYDGDGNRVAKTVGGVTTRYLVDDLNPTGYAQVIEEVVGGSVQRTYTYGNALVSQKQLGTNETSFYGADAHGSVRLLTNGAGAVTDTYDYEAFGNLISATGTTANDYGYSGERFDSDLGTYHLRERDYSPQRGRFLTTDPFAGFTDLPRTLHKYVYVGADPVNYIDPSGLTETTEIHVNVLRTRLCVVVGVVLDTNVLIDALIGGELPALDIALGGRTPIVPIRAAREFLTRHSPDLLREFLVSRGGRIGRAGSQNTVKALQDLAKTLGRRLGASDAEIAASAIREGANVLTRDQKFLRFLRHANSCRKIPITGETF